MTSPTQTTTPQPPAAPPGWEILAVHAAEILALEHAATALVGPFRRQLQALTRAVMAAWVHQFGALDAPSTPIGLHQVVTTVLGQLHSLDPGDLADQITTAAEHALETGTQQSVDALDVSTEDRFVPVPRRPKPPAPEPVSAPEPAPAAVEQAIAAVEHDLTDQPPALDEVIRSELGRLDGAVRERITAAAQEAHQLGADARWADVQGVLSRAIQAATGAENIAAWVVNAAANQGSREVAARLGVQMIWIAERDACATCLALSGAVSKGGVFDASATFAAKPMPVWPPGELLGPPRHPRCRCRIQPWLGSVPGYTGPDLPAALKREARRSIVTGWRLASESETSRLAAAARLLRRGAGLPKTVEARGWKSVERGHFGQFPRPPRRPRPTATTPKGTR